MSETVLLLPPPTPPPVDYNPVLPPAVRRQAELAERLLREQPGQPQITTVGNSDGDPPPADAPPSVEQVAPAPEPVTPAGPAPDAWERQYREAEARRREAEQDAQAMRDLVASMRLNTAAQVQTRPTAPEIPPEDRETYGEDLVNATQRWAHARVAPEIEALKAQVLDLTNQAQQTSVRVQQSSVHAALDGAMPEWRTIDTDPGFANWLQEPDPLAGRRRREMMGEAYVRGEGPRVIAFYNAFNRERGGPATGARTEAATPYAPAPTSAGSVSLEDLASPGRVRAPAAPQDDPTRVYRSADITAFYNAVNKGRYAGREAEKARLEADLHRAVAEGRIR